MGSRRWYLCCITQDTSYKPSDTGPNETETITLTGINKDKSQLKSLKYNLGSNYPNPFNPVTLIHYSLPKSSHVKLEVFDIQGRQVKTLIDTNQNAGQYEIKFDGTKLSSGIYIYRFEANRFTDVKRMLLIK